MIKKLFFFLSLFLFTTVDVLGGTQIYSSQGSLLYFLPKDGMHFNSTFSFKTNNYTKQAADGGSFASYDMYQYEGQSLVLNNSFRYSFIERLILGIDFDYCVRDSWQQVAGKNNVGSTLSPGINFNNLEAKNWGIREPKLFGAYRFVDNKEYAVTVDGRMEIQIAFLGAEKGNTYSFNGAYSAIDGNFGIVGSSYGVGGKFAQKFGNFEWSSDAFFKYITKGTYTWLKSDSDITTRLFDTAVSRLSSFALKLDSTLQYRILDDFTVGGIVNIGLAPGYKEIYFLRDGTATYNKKFIDEYPSPFFVEIGALSRYLISETFLLEINAKYGYKSSITLKQTWTDLAGNNPQYRNYTIEPSGVIFTQASLGIEF